MPRSVTDTDVLRESFGRSYSPEDMEHTESRSVSGEGHGASVGRTFTTRRGPKLWAVFVMSVLSSAVAVAAVGCLCALIYPILKELRAERLRGEDRTEERMLGFWSILVLSVLAGCICCVFSWTLTYLDSQQSGIPALTLTHFRDGFHMGYGVAVLNGIMAMLTVIWSLN